MRKFVLAAMIAASALMAGFHANAEEYSWKAKWISKEQCKGETNTWLAFRKDVTLEKVPSSLVARIAADSKYWMWINGEMVVFEGSLKRGPAPGDCYYDKVDIAPYLHEGENQINILMWYFGRSGFSHMSSGMAAMIFDARAEGVEILSNDTWQCAVHPGYSTAHCRSTNFRLPENNVRYDANAFSGDWYKGGAPKNLGRALEIGIKPGLPPFGKLVERPIPLWKDHGYHEYVSTRQSNDTLYCRLPYNCHFSPCLKVDAPAGRVISMVTDHDIVTGEKCVSGEYVTKAGVQEYEHLPWMNGELLMYIVPSDVKVLEVKYHETGYNTDFVGTFSCDDPFLNDYWNKAVRTMYVNMRDTYFDCPDRERAQWWGDIVNDLNEAFYCLDRKADLLAIKGLHELADWQKEDGVLYAPIPCSNWYKELPMQILNAIGWYGAHNLWFYTDDVSFVPGTYDAFHKYIHEVWELDADGLPVYRTGAWDWPDAGEHQDSHAQLHMWYYLALKAEACFARMLGKDADAAEDEAMMKVIADKLNADYWNGTEYRTPGHTDVADDRVQALAVISGIASADKYPAIRQVLAQEFHATTYMTPYVLDALYTMGNPEMALARMKKMYPTVMKEDCSTLYEHWNYDGTCNHAWAGAGIISMVRQLAGVDALEPAYRRFKVAPQMGSVRQISTSFVTKYGEIAVKLDRKGKRITAVITVPEGTECDVTLSNGKPATLSAGTHTVKL